MSVLVSMVLANVATVLNDAAMVRWTQPELLSWASEAETELVKKTPAAATKTVIHQLVAGAKQTSPADCIAILDMRQNENGPAITPCNRSSLDQFSPNWMATPTADTVTHWMSDPQPDVFYVYPAQSVTPSVVVITYAFKPPALTSMGNLNVRDMYQPDIENYILYRALSKDAAEGSANRAAAFAQAFYGGAR